MMVKARFWVQSVKRVTSSGNGIVREVILAPVIRSGLPGEKGNVDWSKYTPSGEIKMSVSSDGAGEWFEERQLAGDDIGITFEAVSRDQE